MLKVLSGLLLVLATVMPCGTGLCFHDVGVVSIDAPPDTVWPGEQWRRIATIKNFGTATETFNVFFDMCHGQDVDTVRFWDMSPGDEIQINTPDLDWVVPSQICFDCSMRVWTYLIMDQNRSNDSMAKLIRIGEYQIGLVSIDSPGDTVIADSSYVPAVTAKNSGPRAESLNIECLIDSVYGDTQQVPDLLPGQQAQVQFSPWHVSLVETTCTVSFRILDSLDCDTMDNYLEEQVYAKVVPGVAEHPVDAFHANCFFLLCNPNPFVKNVAINWSAGSDRQAVLQVYDVTGRLVRTLAESSIPGRQLRAMWDGKDEAGKETESGIYFICVVSKPEVYSSKIVRVR
jgi:hypothetical protein